MSGCEYCGVAHARLVDAVYDGDGVCLDMTYNGVSWGVRAAGYHDGGLCCGVARAEILFCPFCGRRLDGGDAE